MEYEVSVREVPATRVVTSREKVDRRSMSQVVPQLIDKVEASLAITSHGPAFLSCPAPASGDWAALDADETEEIEVGFIVSVDEPDALFVGPNEVRDLTSRRAATTTHVGPYSEIGAAYSALQSWIKDNGETPASHCDEIYLTKPGSIPPEEYRTELVWPLQ